MNKYLTAIISFFAGVILGSFCSYKVTKTIQTKTAQEQIDSVVKSFTEKYNGPLGKNTDEKVSVNTDTDTTPDNRKVQPAFNDNVKKEYHDYAAPYKPKNGIEPKEVVSTTEDKKNATKSEKTEQSKIYVLTPEEFTSSEMPTKTLYYFADDVLADENDDIISCPSDYIGDALMHIGEYLDDSVFVRNEVLGTDYEVIICPEAFHTSLHKHYYDETK